MREKKILTCAFIAVVLSVCVSCEPVAINGNNTPTSVDTPTIHYDTLTFVRQVSYWHAHIRHLSHNNGILKAHLAIMPSYDVEERDSIPYRFYHVIMMAETQDTLLPLGTYTMAQDKPLYISSDRESSFAVGAENKSWYKEIKPYYYKDVIVHIGRDTIQDYYLELFVQMEEGENLYLHCSHITRQILMENREYYSYPYYPDSRNYEDYY